MADYKKITFRIEPQDPWLDLLCHALSEANFEGFQTNEDVLEAYISSDQYDVDIVQAIVKDLSEAKISFQTEEVPHQNWNQKWELNFEPVVIANRISVIAPFHEKQPDLEYELVITPKMSFGTGHHATTGMVLEEMLSLDFNNASVLDVGCGTGILAIFAEKLKASKIIAIDIDDWCVENCLENVLNNDCHCITVKKAMIIDVAENSFNVILANINRNTILNDLKSYSSKLGANGQLVLSGFIQNDVSQIRKSAEAEGFVERKFNNKDEWCLLTFEKGI